MASKPLDSNAVVEKERRIEIRTYSDWFDRRLSCLRIEHALKRELEALESAQFSFQRRQPLKRLCKFITSLDGHPDVAFFDEACISLDFMKRLFGNDLLNHPRPILVLYLSVFEGACLLSSDCCSFLAANASETLFEIFSPSPVAPVAGAHSERLPSPDQVRARFDEDIQLRAIDVLEAMVLDSVWILQAFCEGTGPDNVLTEFRSFDTSKVLRCKCLEFILLWLRVYGSLGDPKLLESIVERIGGYLGRRHVKELVAMSASLEFAPEDLDRISQFVEKLGQET